MASSSVPLKSDNSGLPQVHRYITTTNAEGKAVISTEVPAAAQWQTTAPQVDFFLGYATRQFPVSLAGDKDLTSYSKDLASPPGLSISGGTVLRYVDIGPGNLSPMHKTVSLDYGVVLEGVVELVLDSGETRVMNRGDVCIQRATNHAWRNVTPNSGWARMMYVLVAAAKNEGFTEDLSDMTGVPKSD